MPTPAGGEGGGGAASGGEGDCGTRAEAPFAARITLVVGLFWLYTRSLLALH